MDEKEEEPFRGWSQHWCVQWARCVLFLHTQLRPQHQPSPPPHLSRAGRPWGFCCSAGLQQQRPGRVRDTDQNDWGFHPFCSDHMHWATAWYVTFQIKRKWHHEDGGPERWVALLTFQLPVGSGCSGQEDTLPGTQTEKRGPVNAHSPVQGRRLPPQVISPRYFSSRSSQLSLDNPWKPWPTCPFTVRSL